MCIQTDRKFTQTSFWIFKCFKLKTSYGLIDLLKLWDKSLFLKRNKRRGWPNWHSGRVTKSLCDVLLTIHLYTYVHDMRLTQWDISHPKLNRSQILRFGFCLDNMIYTMYSVAIELRIPFTCTRQLKPNHVYSNLIYSSSLLFNNSWHDLS